MSTTNSTAPVINQQTTHLCHAISDLCPVDQTVYGYYPNLGVNVFFLAFFAILCAVNVFQGIKYKTWTYMTAVGVGALGEAIGYVGRVLMHKNPWSSAGFETQICCLIISPAFIAAGIYLTLKHIVIELGADSSRLRPKLYTWIFIGCDLLSLALQAAGGGTAASANPGSKSQTTGTDLMITGIVWQVITLLGFGTLVMDYVIRSRGNHSPGGLSLLRTTRFRMFVAGLVLAFITVFTRCVYRIAELAPGWRNPIMQNETEFIVLDGVMVAVATLCLTVFHPGYIFPEMQMHQHNLPAGVMPVEKSGSASDLESSPDSAEKKGHFGSKFIKGRMGRH